MSATSPRARSRTARSSGWRSACCCARSRSCCSCDEPVAGMSPEERTRTGDLIRLTAERCTVLCVEHDMDFLRRFADRVTVMDEGKILKAASTVAEVQADERVQEIYIGKGRGIEETDRGGRRMKPCRGQHHRRARADDRPVRHLARRRRRRAHRRARPQRRRQDVADERPHGRPAAALGPRGVQRRRHHQGAAVGTRQARPGLHPPGTLRVPADDGQGEPHRHHGVAQGRQAVGHRRGRSTCSRA